MFESVKQDVRPNAMSYFMALLVSIITHAVIVCAMVSLPLIFYSPLNARSPIAWLIDSSVPAENSPPPPPPSSSTVTTNPGAGPDEIIYRGPFAPPERIPTGIPAPVELPEPTRLNRLGSGGGIGILPQQIQDKMETKLKIALIFLGALEVKND